MSNETITLATTYDPLTFPFPGYASPKYDGVPVDIYRDEAGVLQARSRQGETVFSVDHILADLYGANKLNTFEHIVGEIVLPQGVDAGGRTVYADFQTTSGLYRRKVADADTDKLELRIFDCYKEGEEDTDFDIRFRTVSDMRLHEASKHIRYAPQHYVECHADVVDRYQYFEDRIVDLEGVMVHTITGASSFFGAGVRSKGNTRWKKEETLDLPLHSFEEAINAKTKQGKGMVGRLMVEYNGEIIGVGPGKLKHAERTAIFENPENYIGKMMQILFKPSTYKALREARFDRWRPDKDATTKSTSLPSI